MRREDRRPPCAQEQPVQLGDEPLDVQDVASARAKGREAEWMLDHFERQSEAGALEDPRGERVKELPPVVPVLRGNLTEAETRGDELDVRARAHECGRELVVVGRRERRWICQDDPHPTVGYAPVSGESSQLLVRTWNLYHGNTLPPRRRAFLREMIELVTADRPAIVCLQEVPVWALGEVARWSGMTVAGAVAAHPRLGSAEVGRRLTKLHNGLFRSAFTGQANAILVDRPFTDERTLVVSTSGERRICQTLRMAELVVANFHVTGGAAAEPQLARVVGFVTSLGDRLILAGDANLRPGAGATYLRLREEGFSEPLAGSIDQIVVRGLPSTPPRAWAEERRRLGDRVLSDHAPVELTVG